MQHQSNEPLDLAEIWRAAERRRTDDISASDVDIFKTVATFSGIGLLISLFLAIFGLDIGTGF
jgi:hypothetical protein